MTQPHPARLHARVGVSDAVVECDELGYLRADAQGRWLGVGRSGVLYRRTNDGRVVRRVRGGWAFTGASAESPAHELAVRVAAAFHAHVSSSTDALEALHGDAALLRERLERAAAWTPTTLAAACERARGTYPEPVRILPPHRYRDLVLQPATGCPNHACTFCAFYQDRPFHALDDLGFDTHVKGVLDILGPAAFERRGIFLGSASAASLPNAVLLRRLAHIRGIFGPVPRGVAAFHDPDHSPRRDQAAWHALAEAGLTDLTIGLETADPVLRQASGKRADLVRLADTMQAQRAAGMRVSLTILVGLGGPAAAERHLAATVAWVAEADLSATDTLYLSPLSEGAASPKAAPAVAGWRRALDQVTAARLVDYRIERFAWLA